MVFPTQFNTINKKHSLTFIKAKTSNNNHPGKKKYIPFLIKVQLYTCIRLTFLCFKTYLKVAI